MVCIVKGISHDCVIGYPDLIAVKAVMNIVENNLLWKGTKLPLISYTFRDRKQVNFVHWEGEICNIHSCNVSNILIEEGIQLPDKRREELFQLLKENDDVFFKKGDKLGQCHLSPSRKELHWISVLMSYYKMEVYVPVVHFGPPLSYWFKRKIILIILR